MSLEAATTAAQAAGVVFYEGNKHVWLADAVPARIIEPMQS